MMESTINDRRTGEGAARYVMTRLVWPTALIAGCAFSLALLGGLVSARVAALMFALGSALGVALTKTYLTHRDPVLADYFAARMSTPALGRGWLFAACAIPVTVMTVGVMLRGITLAPNIDVVGVVSTAAVFAIQPTAEEVVMRLLLVAALIRLRVPVALAVLAQAVFFAALHPAHGPWSQLAIVAGAVALSVTMLLYHSIWGSVLIHTVFNVCEITRGLLGGMAFDSVTTQQPLSLGQASVPLATATLLLVWVFIAYFVSRHVSPSRRAPRDIDARRTS
jgi:Type II CAAX prenyl endopeptidase Rce1-like